MASSTHEIRYVTFFHQTPTNQLNECMHSWHGSLRVSQGEKMILPPWKLIFTLWNYYYFFFTVEIQSIKWRYKRCRVYTRCLNVCMRVQFSAEGPGFCGRLGPL